MWPGKGALHDPALGQQHKTLLGFWRLGRGQAHALRGGGFGWLFALVALIGEGRFDGAIGDRLGGLRQTFQFDALINVGRRDPPSQQVARRVRRDVRLGALLALGAVMAGFGPGRRFPARSAGCGCPQ